MLHSQHIDYRIHSQIPKRRALGPFAFVLGCDRPEVSDSDYPFCFAIPGFWVQGVFVLLALQLALTAEHARTPPPGMMPLASLTCPFRRPVPKSYTVVRDTGESIDLSSDPLSESVCKLNS